MLVFVKRLSRFDLAYTHLSILSDFTTLMGQVFGLCLPFLINAKVSGSQLSYALSA